MAKTLIKGDEVTIMFNPADMCVTPGMLKYNGRKAIVSKVIKPKRASMNATLFRSYELKGVESDHGIPYTFTRDMLYWDEIFI